MLGKVCGVVCIMLRVSIFATVAAFSTVQALDSLASNNEEKISRYFSFAENDRMRTALTRYTIRCARIVDFEETLKAA